MVTYPSTFLSRPSPEDILVSTLPAKKLRQLPSTVLSPASLLGRSDSPDSSLGAQLPASLLNARSMSQNTLAVQGSTRGQGWERAAILAASMGAYLSLLPLQAEFLGLLHQLVCQSEHTHTLSGKAPSRRGPKRLMPRPPLSPPASPKEEASAAPPAQPKGGASSWDGSSCPPSRHCPCIVHPQGQPCPWKLERVSAPPLHQCLPRGEGRSWGLVGVWSRQRGTPVLEPKCLRRRQGRGSQAKDPTSDLTSSFPSSMLTSQSRHKGLEPCGQV